MFKNGPIKIDVIDMLHIICLNEMNFGRRVKIEIPDTYKIRIVKKIQKNYLWYDYLFIWQ